MGKISQFEFLVMTEKNIFAYKLFLSLNISDFHLFLCENCNSPLKKVTPSFSATPLYKLRSCQALLFENLVEGQTPLQKGGGVPTMVLLLPSSLEIVCSFYISWITFTWKKGLQEQKLKRENESKRMESLCPKKIERVILSQNC